MPVIPPPQTNEAAVATAMQPPPIAQYTPPGSPLKTASPIPLNRHMPMKNLPAIPRANSVAEAQAQRQAYQPPNIVPGEMVYYRRKAGNDEDLAFVLKMQNKSFSLRVAANNNVFTEINSVDYYDHTEEHPQMTGDPMAGHHSYGTFRRTPFGKMVLELVARMTGQGLTDSPAFPATPSSVKLEEDLKNLGDSTAQALLGLGAEVEELKKQLATLNEALTPKQPPAEPKKPNGK